MKTDVLRLHLIALMISCLAVLVCGQAALASSPLSLPEELVSAAKATADEVNRSSFALPEKNSDQNQPMGSTAATGSPFSPPENLQRTDGQSLSREPDPPNAEQLLAKGIKLAREDRWREAGQAFEAATQADRGNAAAWCNLGLAYSRLKKNQKALAAYEHALQADPGFALAHKNLALAFEHSEQYAKAVNSYEQYLRLKPDAEDARRVRARAKWLKKNKVK